MNELYEYIGYAGSILVDLSLMMKNILRLRVINLAGAAIFSLYGLLIGALPVFFMNGFIAFIDLYYLLEMFKKNEKFEIMPLIDQSHPYLNKFLKFYGNDIKKFFPELKFSDLKNAECYFVLRNLMPAGIFAYNFTSENEANIIIDYAVPDYRDFQNAKFLFKAEDDFFQAKNIKKITAKASIKKHSDYLKKIGFKLENNLYVKKI